MKIHKFKGIIKITNPQRMKEISEKILKEELEILDKYLVGNFGTPEMKKYIKGFQKRTLAECQKQKDMYIKNIHELYTSNFSDFVKKLKSHLCRVDENNPCGKCFPCNEIDALAKEFGIKQVGEE